VASVAQPPCEPPPGATVDEKFHPSATLTASMRSLAITACA
jgi:hypothetical protein